MEALLKVNPDSFFFRPDIMKNYPTIHFLIFFSVAFLLLTACKETDPPTPGNDSVFMLAILNLESQFPIDFESYNVSGDYKSSSGLLRIQAANTSGDHTIELTIPNTGDEVLGTYPIGNFNSSASLAKAEYITTILEDWSARSTSGTFTITDFSETETPNTWLLSGTFSFEGDATKGSVSITTGEIQNAILITE